MPKLKTIPLTSAELEELEAAMQDPLWEAQCELEYGMMRAGADKVRAATIKAENRGQYTRAKPVRNLMTDYVPILAGALRGWLKDTEASKGGPKPIAYPYLKDTDPEVAAMVALRTILDGLAKDKRKLTTVCFAIGTTLEYEQQVRMWRSNSKEDLKDYERYALEHHRNRATDVHRRKVNIAQFNKRVKEGRLEWDPWPNEVQFRVGWTIVETLIRKTGWFELVPDPDVRATPTSKPPFLLNPKAHLLEWLGKALDHAEETSPEYGPTIIKPRRWSSTREGGYWTPYVRPPRLIRFKAHQEHQKQRAANEYDSLDMPNVYNAVHTLQETAWCINRRVLDVALVAQSIDEGIGKMPIKHMQELPPRSAAQLEHLEAWRAAGRTNRTRPVPSPELDKEIFEWKLRAAPIHRNNAKRAARYISVKATLDMAQTYRQYDRIYFPHMLDFRGRIYPVSSYLQPQGQDLARGLLCFADGMQITEENGGAGWLAIQLATCWGKHEGVKVDALPFEERIQFVEENETLWRLIAENPWGSMEWSKCDSPWQALAAIFEWVDFLNTGWGFESRLPVMVDGTCNGLQHLAAITRDPVVGRYVNLVPAEAPQDIYRLVAVGGTEAEGLQEILERIERAGGPEGLKAQYWLELCNRDLPRTLTKRQVMVLPYGGKMDAFFKYTREWLDEHDPAPVPFLKEDRERRQGRITFLAKHMHGVVGTVVREGLRVMKWLQDCAKVLGHVSEPIYWETPSGFTVRHFYGQYASKQLNLFLDGERVQVRIAEFSTALSVADQTSGIAPNFTHSLDAAALVLCITRCKEAGIEEFVSVHDAYGTHAANMGALNHFLRETFVEVHEHDLLGHFRECCKRVLVDNLVATKGRDPLRASEEADELLPPPLETGTLDIREVLHSDYFFA